MCFWRLLLFHIPTDPALRLPPFCRAGHWKSEIISQKILPVPAHHDPGFNPGWCASNCASGISAQSMNHPSCLPFMITHKIWFPLSLTHTLTFFFYEQKQQKRVRTFDCNSAVKIWIPTSQYISKLDFAKSLSDWPAKQVSKMKHILFVKLKNLWSVTQQEHK